MVGTWWIASYIGLWLLTITMALVLLAAIRQIGVLDLRYHPSVKGANYQGPAFGQRVELASRLDIDSSLVDFSSIPDVTLVFVAPTCRICEALVGDLHRVFNGYNTHVVLISRASVEENKAYRSYRGIKLPIIADPLGDLGTMLQVVAIPYVIRLSAYTVIQKGAINALEDVETILESSATAA